MSWIRTNLKSITTIEYGKSQIDVAVPISNFPIYGTGGIVGFSKVPLFKAPLILIGRKGTINKPILIQKDCWLIDTTFAIKPNDKADVTFLYYMLIYSQLEKLNEATGVPSLSRENLFHLQLTLPPLNQQKKIAEILTSVDRVIELTEIEIEKLKNLKKGMMQDLLTKGIGHTKFKDSPIGKIPDSWEVVKNKDITTLITKGTTPTSVGYSFENKGINFIKVESLIEDGVIDSNKFTYISKECDESLKRSRLLENDVVMTIAGATVGKLAIIEKHHVPANTNQALGIMRANSSKVDYKFLYYFLKSDYIKQEIGIIQTTGAQPNLSLAQLGNYNVPLPSLVEQKKIVDILSSNEKLIKLKTKKLNDLKNIKKGLMQDLLTGKIRVKI